MIPIIRNRPTLTKKGLSLFFSLIIHAAFIYLGLTLISPVKVYIYKKSIIDVVIVPPEKLFFPQLRESSTNINDFYVRPEEKGLKEDYRLTYERTKPTEQKIKDNIQNKTANPNKAFKSDFSSGFQLNSSMESKLNLSLAEEPNLSLKLAKAKNRFGENGKGEKKKDLNLSKYLYPGFSNSLLTKVYPQSRGPKTGVSSKKSTASIFNSGYNITPWAEAVVGKIQKNWLITSVQEIAQKSQVGISVTVEKNGELVSLKVVNPSPVQSFDQDALNAINLSLPFPQLPVDFPKKRLQIYLLFQGND
ncbi:MAG: TonB family protein [bacterium]